MKRALQNLLPPVAFLLVAVAWTYPLVLHLADHVPGEVAGDNLSFLWNLWWMRESGPHFFHTRMLFAPFGTDLVLHTHTALQGAIAATVLRRLDVVAAQNVIVIATLAFNGLAAYLLALDRFKDRAGAYAAGIVFGGPPYVAAHLLGHFSLIGVWTIPLFLLCLTRALERSSRRWSAATGACLAAVAYTDYYYTVFCVVLACGALFTGSGLVAFRIRPRPVPVTLRRTLLSALFVVLLAIALIAFTGGIDTQLAGVRIRATTPGNLTSLGWLLLAAYLWLRLRPRLQVDSAGVRSTAVSEEHAERGVAVVATRLMTLAPGALVFVVCVMPLLLHAVSVWRAGDYSAPPHFWRSGPGGVDLASLVLGNPFHPLTGAWTSAIYRRLELDHIEGVGWLGVVPTLLLIWGTWRAVREPDLRRLVMAGLFFFVWALGPWLRVAGWNTGLMLPANFFGLVPILSNARIPGRAIVVTLLVCSLLAARWIAGTRATSRARVAWSLAILVMIDFLPAPYPLTPVHTPLLYSMIPSTEPGTILELPLGLRDGFEEIGTFDEHSLQYQMQHGHPITGGFVARLAPSIKRAYAEAPLLRSFLRLSMAPTPGPDPRDLALSADGRRAALDAAGIRFVVIDREHASPDLVAFATATIPMRSVRTEGQFELFRVAD